MRELEDKHWWFRARRKIIRKILSSNLPSGNDLDILEIGCGSGGNLEMLSQFGKIHAIETDDFMIEAANKRGFCQVLKGSLPNDIPFDSKFDVICIFDVLEHVENDIAAIRKIWELLKPGGRVFITLPAFMFLWSQHDEFNQHKRRYNLPDIMGKLSKNGFRIIFSSYFNTFLFPLILLLRIVGRLFKKKEDDLSMPSQNVNSILYSIMGAEAGLIGRGIPLPFGVSIIAVAVKEINT